MDLEVLQFQHRSWVARNFPQLGRSELTRHGFLGMVEEVGEIAHAMLKHEQMIRGMREYDDFLAAVADGIGDTVIFADTLCIGLGLDFPSVVKETWAEVYRRDWVKFPKDGVSE